MFRLALTVAVFSCLSAYAGLNPPPGTVPYGFSGQCMVSKAGKDPANVSIAYGASVELFREGDVVFTAKYGNQLPHYGVFQLSVTDAKTKKESLVSVFVGHEFPRRVDLVSDLGSISCYQN